MVVTFIFPRVIIFTFRIVFAFGASYHCSFEHKGPYLQLCPIGGGLFNQWLGLYGSIYQSLLWTKRTGGTVILPIEARERRNFNESYGKSSYPILTTEIFDLSYTVQRYKTIGVDACFCPFSSCTETIYRNISKTFSIRPIRFTVSDPGLNPEKLIHQANNTIAIESNLSLSTKNIILYATSNFGGVEIPFNVTNYFDLALSRARFSALAIRFNGTIRARANFVRNMLNDKAKRLSRSIIGIHLRIEKDWDTGQDPRSLLYRLDQYSELIYQIIDAADPSEKFMFYIACGELDDDYARVRDTWLATFGFPVFYQDSFRGRGVRKRLRGEAGAASDYLILEKLDYFIGCASSSFSYVVFEIRNYYGRPSLLMRKPGFPIWWPIYAPRTYNWHQLPGDPEPPGPGTPGLVEPPRYKYTRRNSTKRI